MKDSRRALSAIAKAKTDAWQATCSFLSPKSNRVTTNTAGIKVGGININNIRYADDTALIATSQVNLHRLVDRVVVENTAYGMEVNVKKSECMVMTKKESVPECRITINGEMVKQLNNFKYLGSNITSNGRCVTEVKCRIAQAKRAFVELDNILKNKKMTIQIFDNFVI